jgi:hypothetical protein
LWSTRRRDRARLELGEEAVELLRRDGAAEPAEAGEEHELQLRDDGPVRRTNRSWKRPSAKWSSIPAPPTQPTRPSTTNSLRWSMRPGRAHDAHVDAAGPQPVVEPAGPAGTRADPVDDDPHGDALGGLREQRAGEPLPDLAGPEAVLVDVDRARRARDVVEDRGKKSRPDTRTATVDGPWSRRTPARGRRA